MKYWTAEEESFLKDNYETLSKEEIVLKLGRTWDSLYKRVKSLGLGAKTSTLDYGGR